MDNGEIKDTIIHQNKLSHLVDPTLKVKFTKRSFNEARHVVIEVSPKLRIELLILEKIKIRWSMCRAEDFVAVTRCFRCLGFGHTSKYCQSQQKCSYWAEDHHWKECGQQHQTRCSNCLKANSFFCKNLFAICNYTHFSTGQYKNKQTPTFKKRKRKLTPTIAYSVRTVLN
jgi:hypothetical protein